MNYIFTLILFVVVGQIQSEESLIKRKSWLTSLVADYNNNSIAIPSPGKDSLNSAIISKDTARLSTKECLEARITLIDYTLAKNDAELIKIVMKNEIERSLSDMQSLLIKYKSIHEGSKKESKTKLYHRNIEIINGWINKNDTTLNTQHKNSNDGAGHAGSVD